jgi:hypothetical protein
MVADTIDLTGIPLLDRDRLALVSLVRHLTRSSIQSAQEASNTIGRATELVAKVGLELSSAQYSQHCSEYRSAYSEEHSDRGGADFKVDVAGTLIATEAEQRTHGYSTDRNIFHEVTDKLRKEGARHRVYYFFTGYEQQPLNDVLRRVNPGNIEVFVLDPMPYTGTLDGQYAFNRDSVVE